MATQISLVQQLMLKFVNAMLADGPESAKLDKLLAEHHANAEFVRLATLARRLKRSALAADERYRPNVTANG